jgi:leucyl aminopeptidase
MATLTGAAIISLGTETTALMTNEQSLADKLLAAGEKASDATWQLPLNSDYDHYLNSDVADFLNASLSRAAGTIVAANFLSRFTKKMKWAHLDIAGTATTTGRQAAATGRPIPLLVNYLLTQGKPGK